MSAIEVGSIAHPAAGDHTRPTLPQSRSRRNRLPTTRRRCLRGTGVAAQATATQVAFVAKPSPVQANSRDRPEDEAARAALARVADVWR